MRRIGLVAGSLLAVVAGAFAGFVWAFRTNYAPVQDRIRRFNRDFTNPRVLQRMEAGEFDEDSEDAVVHHLGRRSGASYATPVGAVPIDDGFVISLPYGSGADWVRNVRAADGAIIERDGERHPVVDPEILPVEEAGDWFDRGEQQIQRLFGVEEVLVLHHAADANADVAEARQGT